MPISAATPAIAQGSGRGGDPVDDRVDDRSAPPESASSPPIIAPSAMSSPTLPTVAPTPGLKLAIDVADGHAGDQAEHAEPRISARNGWTFSQVISTTTTAMPSRAARTSRQ